MSSRDCFRSRLKRVVKLVMAVLVAVYFLLCFSMRLTEREVSPAEGGCMLYYVVNADGMKGLGHSMILLVDEEGCGTVLSFNGMQRTLWESLMGKSGVGKLSIGAMTVEETDAFLRTGDLELEGDQLQDNYDIALYRPVTLEEYHIILEQTVPYMAAEEQFTALYEKWATEGEAGRKAEYKQALERLGQDGSLPLYQIYTNNCDHTARVLISAVDASMRDYMQCTGPMTPNGNLKAFGKEAGDWGVILLGGQTLWEKFLMFFVIF